MLWAYILKTSAGSLPGQLAWLIHSDLCLEPFLSPEPLANSAFILISTIHLQGFVTLALLWNRRSDKICPQRDIWQPVLHENMLQSHSIMLWSSGNKFSAFPTFIHSLHTHTHTHVHKAILPTQHWTHHYALSLPMTADTHPHTSSVLCTFNQLGSSVRRTGLLSLDKIILQL